MTYGLLTWKKSRFGIASAIAQTSLEWSPQSQTMRAMLNDLEMIKKKEQKKKDFESDQDKKERKRKKTIQMIMGCLP